WSEEGVSKRLEELHVELHIVKKQNEIQHRVQELRSQLNHLHAEFQAVEMKREDWLKKLSNLPELELENLQRYSGLNWFLKNLQQWQKTNNELQGNRRAYDEEKNVYSKTLEKVNQTLVLANVE